MRSLAMRLKRRRAYEKEFKEKEQLSCIYVSLAGRNLVLSVDEMIDVRLYAVIGLSLIHI